MSKGKKFTFAGGELAEWSNAAVLKTVEGHTSGGSNPSFSAEVHRKMLFYCNEGEMPEWSNGAVSKTVDRASGPRVRIPVSPQQF